jgi:hypothetical protein
MLSSNFLRSHGDIDSAFALGGELDGTLDHREDRMILAQSDAHAWMPLGAALAHEDVAGYNVLAAEALYAKPLGV